jgi:16S rRNA (cytidine1402-2'-O)-methyltransferase
MSGTLFVVATPIGNLEDISLRALRILKEVALVAAEDTRRSGNLLRHYGIQTPTLSLHSHNEGLRVPQILDKLRRGQSVAIVTDAGTPGVSDPGMDVAEAALAAGYRVEPIPGPSAVTAALLAAGLPFEQGFVFLGFPPTRGQERRRWFERLFTYAAELPVVAFEAPHRLLQTIEELGSLLGEQPIIVAKELTKLHEKIVRGSARELPGRLQPIAGEYTLVVPARPLPIPPGEAMSDDEIAALVGQIAKTNGLAPRAAVRAASAATGLPPNRIYAAVKRGKDSVE